MGRRPSLPAQWTNVDHKYVVPQADADYLWQKYGFRRANFDFHWGLNEALIWGDIYRRYDERPAKESIKILRAIGSAATSLRACFDTPGADKLLRIHHEDDEPDPQMRVHDLTHLTFHVLVSLEGRCRWRAPAKRLRQDIRNASQRLRDALLKAAERSGRLADKEICNLFTGYGFAEAADLPHALDRLIQASTRAVSQIEDRTRQDPDQPDVMPEGNPGAIPNR